MSFSQHERGKFIRERMGYLQLIALGKGQMTAEGCDDLDKLVEKGMETSGSTHNEELAKEPLYKQAIKDWRKVKERRLNARQNV